MHRASSDWLAVRHDIGTHLYKSVLSNSTNSLVMYVYEDEVLIKMCFVGPTELVRKRICFEGKMEVSTVRR